MFSIRHLASYLLLLFTVCLLVAGIARADTINALANKGETTTSGEGELITVLRIGPVGAGNSLWAEAVADTLRSNNYTVNMIGFNNCKESAQWANANPDTPYVYFTFSDYAILDMLQPTHPAACGAPWNPDNLITIVGQWWNFICGRTGENDSIEALVNSDGAKVGVWNYPVSQNVAKAHVKALGSNASVIGFASGKTMMTAFNTKDIDYIIMSSENLAKSLTNATCFGTAANKADAATFMPDRVSYENYPNVPFIGYGLWPMVMGENVDHEKLRRLFIDSPSATYRELQKNVILETRPVDEQIQDLNRVAEQLKGLL